MPADIATTYFVLSYSERKFFDFLVLTIWQRGFWFSSPPGWQMGHYSKTTTSMGVWTEQGLFGDDWGPHNCCWFMETWERNLVCM